jgi:methylthioribose-1-phosphate isomerase
MDKVRVGFKTIEWVKDRVRILDQTLLPESVIYKEINSPAEMREAIRLLRVRGAPLIGISGAYGAALSAYRHRMSGSVAPIRDDIRLLRRTRPTAVNLFWALERMQNILDEAGPSGELRDALLREAVLIHEEDAERCRGIGTNGFTLLDDGFTIMTHCNAGALATGGIGTALAPVYVAHSQRKRIRVFASETRPLLQGARLTAWELAQNGVDVTLIVDSARGHVLATEKVNCIIVGADRIAANGDTANKIGTYPLSVLAREHGVPFYVAAPLSTFDLTLDSGKSIPIEKRDADEIAAFGRRRIAPGDVTIFNPAFDVTPHEYISCIITEKGVLRPPLKESIADCFSTP